MSRRAGEAITAELGSASLDSALTGSIWKDRILGRSEIVELVPQREQLFHGNDDAPGGKCFHTSMLTKAGYPVHVPAGENEVTRSAT